MKYGTPSTNTRLGASCERAGRSGFTIVELLIVIVVIGVLAAITIVAYSGVQNRASDAGVQNDLSGVAKRFEIFNVETGAYPSMSQLDAQAVDVRIGKGAFNTSTYNFLFCIVSGSTNQRFAIIAQGKSGNRYSYSSSGGLRSYSGAMTTTASTCSDFGISTSEVGYSGGWGFNDGGSGVWRSWIKG